jgi:hypothetical protein
MLDRTNHQRLAEETARRVADKYIPATDRQVERTDNRPPEPVIDEAAVKSYAAALMVTTPAIDSARDASPLLRAFIAEFPVITTPEEAQKTYGRIESARKTLAAMDDERKPKVAPLNAALKIINEPYRMTRETLESLLEILVKRYNKWDADERRRREQAATEARRIAEEAAAAAQALIDQANDAMARADVGECDVDVGEAVIIAEDAMHDANKLDRIARRDEKAAASVRVASELGGHAGTSRRKPVIVIDDLSAAVEAIGPTEKILIAVRQSAAAFKEANGKMPKGCREDYTRSI